MLGAGPSAACCKEVEACLRFADQLVRQSGSKGNPVLVGLDPRAESLPGSLIPSGEGSETSRHAAGYRRFCRGVIDVVAPLVAAVKPQAAFFEQLGPAGMAALAEVIRYAQRTGPVGDSRWQAERHRLDRHGLRPGIPGPGQSPWGADALTVSPYLGDDSLEPFVEVAVEAWCGDLRAGEDVESGRRDVPGLVRRRPAALRARGGAMSSDWPRSTAASAATGRSAPWSGRPIRSNLASSARQMPHTWFLVPGYGSQGGTARDVAAAFDDRGTRGDRQQLPRHHLRPPRSEVCPALRRSALAGGGRGGHARHDRRAAAADHRRPIGAVGAYPGFVAAIFVREGISGPPLCH